MKVTPIHMCHPVVIRIRSQRVKFLSLLGKWILKQEFIKDSHKAQRWLNEDNYEWNEQCTYGGLPTGHISAPYRWRKALSFSHTGPFHGWRAVILLNDPKRRNAYRR